MHAHTQCDTHTTSYKAHTPATRANNDNNNIYIEPILDLPARKIAIQNNTSIYAQQSLCLHSMHVCVHTTLVICVGMSSRPVCLQILAHALMTLLSTSCCSVIFTTLELYIF